MRSRSRCLRPMSVRRPNGRGSLCQPIRRSSDCDTEASNLEKTAMASLTSALTTFRRKHAATSVSTPWPFEHPTGSRALRRRGMTRGLAERARLAGVRSTCPRQDSNLRTTLRRRVLYPLSYGGPCRLTLEHGLGRSASASDPGRPLFYRYFLASRWTTRRRSWSATTILRSCA